MKQTWTKRALLTLIGLLMAIGASALVPPKTLEKCIQVNIYGHEPDDEIEIMALPGDSEDSQGVAFVKIPGTDTNIVRHFHYLVDGAEEGCFGVVERFSYNGQTYSNVALMVSFTVAAEVGAIVEYAVYKGDDTIYSDTFLLKGAKFSNPVSNNAQDKAGYDDSSWAGAFSDFGYWLMAHVEQYQE